MSNRLTNVDELKKEICNNVTIGEVAEHLGAELQHSGEQWRSLCLLHSESTPSMYFSDIKGQYHCFGCKEGGDMIDLVEKVRKLSFTETLYYLAAEADVDISAYERPMTDAEKQEEEFRQWCEHMLNAAPQERPQRALSAEEFGVVVRRGVGNTPAYFTEKEYLLNGIILPWRTPSGRLTGWRVREHDGEEKRIRGTPNDFPLGRIMEQTLFGIQVAREHIKDSTLIVVEGEYDCLALHAAGIRNVVAMGGSTLTDGQMKLIESLHIREVIIVFDGDIGGYAAAKVCAEKYWAHDIFVRVSVCDKDNDPEDIIKLRGDLYFQLAITGGAKAALEFLLRLEWSQKPRTTLTEKLEFVKWIRDTYGRKLRTTDESLVLAEVAKWLEIPELEIRDYVRAADTSLCAIDSERVLIGKAARDRPFYLYLRSQLVRDDFFVLKHQRIWDLLANMLMDGQEFDAVTISTRARQFGISEDYIAGCLELPDSNTEYHKGVVADLALRRAARDDAIQFRDKIQDLQQPADLLVGDLTHRITTKALRRSGATQKQLSEQVDQAMETIHERMRNETEIHGLDLGLQQPRLSRILQGFQPRRLVLVTAVSRVGKSTMLCQWATSMGVHQSIPVDLISLEMDESEILFKIVSHMTGINSEKISGGRLDVDEAKTVEYAMTRIRNSPLHIWAPDGLTESEFLLYARESVMQRHTKAFMLDYIQLIDPEPHQMRSTKYEIYGDFARTCKMKIARSMKVCVIFAAQLRRDAASKEKPTLEDLADSYSIVRHSDVGIILHGEQDAATLELWVDKNRQGPGGGLVPMIYDKPIQTLREAADGSREPEYMVKI